MSLVFGPVPSRRLGRSLGINHIPLKHCSYSCVYCQLGRTHRVQVERESFWSPGRLAAEVAARLLQMQHRQESVDALTFVPDGEPTLDVNLGAAIDRLRPLGVPIAVITNGSLTHRADVRADLAKADRVLLEVDTTDERTWRRLHRPHYALRHEAVLEGMQCFAASFDGTLMTNTMLIRGLNDLVAEMEQTAAFVAQLSPYAATLGVPTRPPCERNAAAPTVATLARCRVAFEAVVGDVQCLNGYDEGDFGYRGDVKRDLLDITAVHPMRHQEVEGFLSKAQADWNVVERLLTRGQLTTIDYRGQRFYVRNVEQ